MSYSDKTSIEQDAESGQRTSSTTEEVDHERPPIWYGLNWSLARSFLFLEAHLQLLTFNSIIGAETSSNPTKITGAGRDFPDFGILQVRSDQYSGEITC